MTKKKISRKIESEIKKQLRNFAKKEYKEKKPLEIRVLQLKPGVVFKKGSMLPNLMIKNLVGSAYVVYLDYGKQLKFYYFAKNGMSMGGSNFNKSEKILKEMHGKATTILKLPKTERIKVVDRDTSQIRKFFHRLAQQQSQKVGINIKNLPAISIKNFTSDKKGIRIGIEKGPDKNIIHFDVKFIPPMFTEYILLRELFPILTKSDPESETVQLISTLWALTATRNGYLKEYTELLTNRKLDLGISYEIVYWIQNKFLEYIEEYPQMDYFADFLIQSYRMILDFKPFSKYKINDIFLLWLREIGIVEFMEFLQIGNRILRKSWIYYNILHYLYKNENKMGKVYGVDTEKAQKDESLLLLFLFSCTILGKKSKFDMEFFEKSIPNYLEIKNALVNLEFSKFPDIIPQELLKEKFVKETLFCMFNNKGLVVDSIDKMNMATNSEKDIDININNMTNWVLSGARFKAEFRPRGRIKLIEIDPEQLQSFEGELKLNIKFKSADIAGKCMLTVKMLFKDPVNPIPGGRKSFKIVYKENILIKEIEINIK
jgi:hypothetical protein